MNMNPGLKKASLLFWSLLLALHVGGKQKNKTDLLSVAAPTQHLSSSSLLACVLFGF